MSTTIKRIALVAVAALGFGVLSVVPSQAAVQNLTVTVADGKATLTVQDTTTAGTVLVEGLLDGGLADTITVSVIQKSVPSTSASVKPLLGYLETTTLATRVDTTTVFADLTAPKYESVTAGGVMALTSLTAAYVGAKFTLQLESSTADTLVAGTYTYTVVVKPFAGGVEGAAISKDVSIVIAAAAVVVPAAGNATAYLQAGATPTFVSVAGDSVTSGTFVNGNTVGQIQVKNLSATNAIASDTITATLTGSGYLQIGSSIGRSLIAVNVESSTISVVSDGTSGTGTVTITTGAGASFVKTVTFFDTKPVKAVATVAKAFIKAGTTAVDDVFAITVTDTLGNAITNTGVAVTAAPTDTATTVGGAATCAWNVKGAAYHCSVAGLSTTKFGPVAYTITATGTGTNSAVKVTTSATVTFADNVATKAVLAGPATGTPGATVEYTLTLTEKNGYPVADQTYGVDGAGGALFATTGTTVSGWSAANAPFNAEDSYTAKSGVITGEGVLPIAGTASITLTLIGDGLSDTGAIGKAIGKTTVTASTDVANPGVDAATDAANEATDAANAATDAALAAAEAADAATTAAQEASDAVAALSESVTKLIAGLQAQIKSLAAVVAKIAKKVKA